MGKPTIITVPAPLLGNEWRDSFQTEQHATILLNADTTRGDVRARPGWVAVDDGIDLPGVGTASGCGLYRVSNPQFGEHVVCFGKNRVGDLIMACDMTPSGQVLRGYYVSSHAGVNTVRFSFVSLSLPSPADERPFFALLAVCDAGVYVYPLSRPIETNGSVPAANYDTVDNGGYTLRLNEANVNYCLRVPPCYIARQHDGRVYYAGFEVGAAASVTSTIEAVQNVVPEEIVDNSRDGLRLGPQWIAWSDVNDPLAIQVMSIARTPDHGAVTALWSFQGALLAFTADAIHAYSGDGASQFSSTTAHKGAGCVGHNALEEVDGVLYFMSQDGIYRYGGGAPEKISLPIDGFFTGQYEATSPPDAFATVLSELGWPFRAAADLRFVNCIHVRSRHELWWTVPVRSRHPDARVVLVYHYPTQAWHIWCSTPDDTINGARATPCIDAVETSSGVVGVTYAGDGGGWVRRLGGPIDDVGGTDGNAVPFIWWSSRMPKAGVTVDQTRPIRLRLLGTGSGENHSPTWVITGENSPYDFDDTTRQEQSGTFACVPAGYAGAHQWGSATWGASKWRGKDWFVQKIPAKITGPSFRFGVIEYSEGTDAEPLFVLHSWAYEGIQGDTR